MASMEVLLALAFVCQEMVGDTQGVTPTVRKAPFFIADPIRSRALTVLQGTEILARLRF